MVRLPPAPLGFAARTWLPGVRNTEAGDRGSVALWEIVQQLGMPTGLVGWPVTFPVREEEEVVVWATEPNRLTAETRRAQRTSMKRMVFSAFSAPLR